MPLLNTSESNSDSAHTALAPPPTVPQDSSSTPQFSPPSVSSASLPGSPQCLKLLTLVWPILSRLPRVRASNSPRSSLPSKAEIPLHLLNPHHNTPLNPHPLLCLLPLPLITLLELHMLRYPRLASLTVNVLMAESGGLVQSFMPAQFISKTTLPRSCGRCLTSRQVMLPPTTKASSTMTTSMAPPVSIPGKNECTQASLTLEGVSYFQGTASVDEYIDNFCALITMAGLNVEPVVEPVLYSMNPTAPTIKAHLEDAKHVEKKVAEAEARPQEWDVVAWYSLAKRFDKHEREDAIFHDAQRSVHPGPPKPTFPSRAQPQVPYPCYCPIPAPHVPAPAQAPLLQGIPMKVDASRQRFQACCTCYTCGKTSHFSAACPDRQHEHVRVVDMSVDDWQEIAEAYMAFQDFQAAPMNEPTQEDFAKDQE
ncbi:hypothetical protein D9758_014546 [Tetrapyrgos nigripes]|uniref:CCHC-type domain-containing protein n=1 Tax=Tetrapyrgos nigripes TaxID=182062 RepID=A0A8H5CFD9_9AGAR|nr:hypothetical protein D9758_014546 [Tetrapyrgos nigripes]